MRDLGMRSRYLLASSLALAGTVHAAAITSSRTRRAIGHELEEGGTNPLLDAAIGTEAPAGSPVIVGIDMATREGSAAILTNADGSIRVISAEELRTGTYDTIKAGSVTIIDDASRPMTRAERKVAIEKATQERELEKAYLNGVPRPAHDTPDSWWAKEQAEREAALQAAREASPAWRKAEEKRKRRHAQALELERRKAHATHREERLAYEGRDEGCRCHISPPCNYCVEHPGHEDDVYPAPRP